jgi:THO complex subunit 1
MPSFDNYVSDVPQVVAFERALREALEHAQKVKPTPSIEPPLSNADAAGLISQLPAIFSTQSSSDEAAPADADNALQFLAIETVVRSRLDTLLATVPIEAPEFVEVWNILDLLTSLEDSQKCDSGLVLSLVEELVDSQTIEGCRIVFDYLESRRERLVKHWVLKKSLIILRTCNELLRRLSRAEDISFSGRVFIFMFQSFPMGDKGTVNLRGVYHTENITTWEEVPPKPVEETADSMEVDPKEELAPKPASKTAPAGAKAVTFDSKDKPASEKPLDADALYPIFWSLQQYFSQPTKLFSAQNMAKFKSGLEATVAAFESVAQGQRNSKTSEDSKDPSKKRKRFEVDTSDGATFNPKYLTSRDLFELEMSDLFFRRHILIQAIIVLDFLGSLSASARAKYTNIQHPNKSVMYSDKVVLEEDVSGM